MPAGTPIICSFQTTVYLVDTKGVDSVWAAALACLGLSICSMVSALAPIPEEEWVAVIGTGKPDLMTIDMLRAHRCERIVTADVDTSKFGAALDEGAAVTDKSDDANAAWRLPATCRSERSICSITSGPLRCLCMLSEKVAK
jgi:D-arabinose 1-dehydrogenase-like Zn-dependent alcohol dehydrogenase